MSGTILTTDQYTRRNSRPAPGRRRRVKWKRLFAWGFALLVLLAIVFAVASYLWFRGVVSEASSGADVAAARDVLDNRPPVSALSLAEAPGRTP
jgi:uncharacterized iron-regulated membrane protein